MKIERNERVVDVAVSSDRLSVTLMDGRIIAAPLIWFPRLYSASDTARQNFTVAGGGFGIHWHDLDEDLSTAGLLRGTPASRR